MTERSGEEATQQILLGVIIVLTQPILTLIIQAF